ncbi:hypothetical protein [Methylobacterium sp. 77]|uniref:hypothetical protein n=1 Tax=Methylobacterium sp. 77 TaxID=1101192 RepID=UPI000380023E|nr:hypothetical protein [Methylobacterium sp. 77]
MSKSPAWFSWFSFPFYAPLSGAVSQEISPYPYQGVPEIEAEVTQDVASFGRQLGIISEAVLELAKRVGPPAEGAGVETAAPHGSDTGSSALATLQAIVDEIDCIKARHGEAVTRDAERAMARLQKLDASKAAGVAARFGAR